MNIPVIFQFLKELSANNNREWFNSHRELYEFARSEFENLLTIIISRISLFDESIRGIEAKDCTYRIYRDIRFSEDNGDKRHLPHADLQQPHKYLYAAATQNGTGRDHPAVPSACD